MRGEFVRVRPTLSLFIAAVLAAAAASSFSAPGGLLVDYFLVQYPSISPNGDGIRDSSIVRVGLADTCGTLLLTLEDAGGAPLDTLIDETAVPPGAILGPVFELRVTSFRNKGNLFVRPWQCQPCTEGSPRCATATRGSPE